MTWGLGSRVGILEEVTLTQDQKHQARAWADAGSIRVWLGGVVPDSGSGKCKGPEQREASCLRSCSLSGR